MPIAKKLYDHFPINEPNFDIENTD